LKPEEMTRKTKGTFPLDMAEIGRVGTENIMKEEEHNNIGPRSFFLV